MEHALGDALWTLVPLVSPRCTRVLSVASPTLRSLISPAKEQAARAEQFARELSALWYFDWGFEPLHLDGRLLEEAHTLLSPLRLLRLRERVGRGIEGGWAPTEQDIWRLRSPAELHQVLEAAHQVRGLFSECAVALPLLLGMTLRREISQARVDGNAGVDVPVVGPLWTAPVGLEWVDGPAADPLQLGLRLGLGPGSKLEIDLELISGGWSEWSASWAASDGSLGAHVALVAILPGGSLVSIVQVFPNAGNGGQSICPADCVASLVAALSEGSEGIRMVIGLGNLRWHHGSPPWCPPEVQDILASAPPVCGSTFHAGEYGSTRQKDRQQEPVHVMIEAAPQLSSAMQVSDEDFQDDLMMVQ